MVNDRQITISVGNNRKSVNWQPQTLMLSEFYEKLRIPSRSTETMQEYLSLRKSEQDDKKDIGGFVAGTLSGPRRKAGAVTGREIITLDFDTIPPGGTEEILKRVDALGCGYCIYSTRKHSPASPRLRILLPLDRTVTADEYEPLARYMAVCIGIEFADPTTFEATRLMYWPSCCKDSEYVFTFGDKQMLYADGLLNVMNEKYGDWRDVSKWPQVPGADNAYKKLAMKQSDPLSKAGVVGAFCRTYDIYGAMDTYLDGIYAPVDDSRGRYTYLGGSTTGGAVVYDNGMFLRDRTGNRRFWPVDVGVQSRKKLVWDTLDEEIDQIWAEAVMRWRFGEGLFLTGELEEEAKEEQEAHREVSSKEGIILDFIDQPVPEDWPKWSLDKRRLYLNGTVEGSVNLVKRDRVCALEIWCEAFGGQPRDFRYSDSTEINDILRAIPGWEKTPGSLRFGYCGKQRGFQRIRGR